MKGERHNKWQPFPLPFIVSYGILGLLILLAPVKDDYFTSNLIAWVTGSPVTVNFRAQVPVLKSLVLRL
jgi:hypothetical protein